MSVRATALACAIAFAALGTLAALPACAQAQAQSVKPEAIGEHPRLPSQPELDRNLLYEEGAPNHAAAAALPPDAARAFARGRTLYETHCITCHGADFRGGAGVPSLEHVGAAAIDFYVGTGRMPGALKAYQAVHQDPHFTPSEIASLDAYVATRSPGGPAIPNVAVDAALLAHGRLLFENNCQGCHGAAGEGASAGGDWIALPLYRATATQIGEAIRIGPGVMPRFSPAQLRPRDVDAVATYVHYLTADAPAYGGFTMDYAGPAAEGLVGGLLGVGALFWVIFFTGTKADGTRLSE